jgi:enoyl-CoA hydratase
MKLSNLSQSGIQAEIQDCLLSVVIDRPSHANAYTQDMLNDLEACIEVANQEDQIRAIVITGSGNNRNWRSVLNLKSASVFKKIRESSKISIAAINGAAVGGGFELAISCDLRIAQSKAQFWLPEPEFGLLPAAAATHLLPKYIGMFRAKDLILGGARWTADDALKAGLLSEVCDEARLTECVMEWVQRIQKRHPDAIRIGKQILELSLAGGDSNSADLLAQALLVINQRHT